MKYYLKKCRKLNTIVISIVLLLFQFQLNYSQIYEYNGINYKDVLSIDIIDTSIKINDNLINKIFGTSSIKFKFTISNISKSTIVIPIPNINQVAYSFVFNCFNYNEEEYSCSTYETFATTVSMDMFPDRFDTIGVSSFKEYDIVYPLSKIKILHKNNNSLCVKLNYPIQIAKIKYVLDTNNSLIDYNIVKKFNSTFGNYRLYLNAQPLSIKSFESGIRFFNIEQ